VVVAPRILDRDRHSFCAAIEIAIEQSSFDPRGISGLLPECGGSSAQHFANAELTDDFADGHRGVDDDGIHRCARKHAPVFETFGAV